MSANGLAIIAAIASLLVLTVLSRIFFQGWLKPGAYFPLAVSIFFIPPLILAPSYYVHAGALWWVLFSVLSFSSGSVLVSVTSKSALIRSGTDHVDYHRKGNIEDNDILRSMPYVLIVSISLGLLSSVILLWFYGRSVSLFFSTERISEIGRNISLIRYSGEYSPPIASQFLLAFVYVSAILGGILCAGKESKRHLILALLSLLPALVVFLVQNTRAALLFALGSWITGYFAYTVFLKTGKRVPVFTKRRVVTVTMVLVFLVIISASGKVIRRGEMPDFNNVANTIRSPNTTAELFGHVSAFSRCLQKEWHDRETPAYGAFNLTGLFKIAGLQESELGGNIWYFKSGSSTTIDTLFAALFKDFTFAGSFLFLFFLGILSSFVYQKVASGSLLLVPLLGAIYLYLGWVLGSIFSYNSLVFAFIIIQIYFTAIWVHKQSRSKSRNKGRDTNETASSHYLR